MKSRTLLAALSGLSFIALAAGSFAAPARTASVALAQETTDQLKGALVAAVATISDTLPPDSPPEQIQAASTAVSLLLPESQSNYRLIDASGNPVDAKNTVLDPFEARGLMRLVGGAPLVQEVVSTDLRTLVPLTNDMHPNCLTCHVDYGAMPAGTVVGAASLRVGL